jgi:hypothetical protein
MTVPMYELAGDRRVAPLLNFTGRVVFTNDCEPAWRSIEEKVPSPAAATASSSSAPAAPLQSPSAAVPTVSSPASGLVASWTIPLHVSVSLGQQVVAGQPAIAPAATGAVDVEAEEAVVVDQDYSDRPGYDPDFLETITVPLPLPGSAPNSDGQNSPNPDNRATFKLPLFAFDRIGLRVPAVIVSPWIAKGTVEHRMLQRTSIIKTVSEIFGLNGLLNHRDETPGLLPTCSMWRINLAPRMTCPRG